MKRNPWLLVLVLIESEAVPAKTTYMQSNVSYSSRLNFHMFENNIPDKQFVVYTKQSVVSISRSRNSFDIRDFSSFKQFQRKIHKNQSILPLFVFTNRL